MVLSIPVSATFAGILGLVYAGLSLNVVKQRLSTRVLVGDGTSELLKEVAYKQEGTVVDFRKYNRLVAAIRAHGNFIEYVPLQLILAAFLELQGVSTKKLEILLGLFTLSRLSHTFGILKLNFLGAGRPIGTFVTFTTLALAAAGNIYLGLPLLLKK